MSLTRVVTITVALSVCANSASAVSIHVPADLPTIQDAVDSAQTGDTVLVAYGRYVEEILIRDKRIYLIGAGSDSSVIDGTGSVTACNWPCTPLGTKGITNCWGRMKPP